MTIATYDTTPESSEPRILAKPGALDDYLASANSEESAKLVAAVMNATGLTFDDLFVIETQR